MFDLIVSLLLICVLAYVSIRLLGKRAAGFGSHRLVRIASTTSLGQHKSLQTVVVDGKTVLLLGVGSNVECVARFDDPDLAERLLRGGGDDAALALVRPAFSWLASLRSKSPLGRDAGPSFEKQLFDRLETLKTRRQQVYSDTIRDGRSVGQTVREADRDERNADGARRGAGQDVRRASRMYSEAAQGGGCVNATDDTSDRNGRP
ncbi:MAG: FliO/MopB family protein [Bacilli bacterium]